MTGLSPDKLAEELVDRLLWDAEFLLAAFARGAGFAGDDLQHARAAFRQSLQESLSIEAISTALRNTLPGDGESRNEAEKKAGALIEEAARLIAPEKGEAVFYIRVGGPYTQCTVKAAPGVEPQAVIEAAFDVLRKEFADAETCPIHAALPNGESRNEVLEEAARAFVTKLDECQPFIDAAFLQMHNHGMPHTGPQYGEELDALKAALSPPQPIVGEDVVERVDAIIARELEYTLCLEPAVAHMSSRRKIDRKDALSVIERIRREVRAALSAAPQVQGREESGVSASPTAPLVNGASDESPPCGRVSTDAWQEPLPRNEPGSSWNFDHPVLAAILRVRRINACDFSPTARSGNAFEAYDQGVLDCYHAVERVMCGLPPAQGMAAATAGETRSGSTVGNSPVREADAPDPSPSTSGGRDD